MKQFACILFFTSLIVSTAQAKIWTVDNTGKVADFNNITAAIAAAASGDTLLLGGSSTAYTDINLTKKLCIIGTGYFLTENPNTIEHTKSVTIANVTFSTGADGSDGSTLLGITCSSITLSTDAITVRRCISSYITINSNNNVIKQNYFGGGRFTTLTVSGINNNIRNNYIAGYYYSGTATWYNAITCGASNIVENNVIYANITITSSSFGNNIMTTGTASFTNCNPYNCIGSSTQFGTSNGNQSSVVMTTVFVSSGTSDGKWMLASSSPGKAAGLGGIDCGMFGGNDPYVLSGIPDIPVITAITVAGRANPANGLNVILNIRSNK
jgi:hypothetical protein